MSITNIDEKLKKEWEITAPLRQLLSEEHKAELNDIAKDVKLKGSKSTLKPSTALQQILNEKVKAIKNSTYRKFPFSKQIEDFGPAHVRLIYNDGKIVEPLSEHYNGLNRKNLKSASVISETGKILFTLDVVNNKLVYRKRNIPPAIQDVEKLKKLANPKYGHMYFDNPKRAIILATQGRIIFVWDSGEIVEITDWSEIRPYDKPNLRNDEK